MSDFVVRDPDFAARVRASFDRQGIMATLGATLVAVSPGQVSIEAPWSPGVTQQTGFFHAGVTTTLLDSACGFAALSLMAPGDEVLSVEFKTNLLAPARGPGLVAHASVLRPGATITVCRGDAFSGDTLVATMTATMIRVPGGPEPRAASAGRD